MAKKTQRRLSRHERDQAGCISGFISMFDFRHGRSTKRLLTDKRSVNKHTVGPGQSNTQAVLSDASKKCENVVDSEESNTTMADFAKTSVKELMEEEMCGEQGSTNQPNDSEHGNRTKKNQKKRRSRSSIKSRDMDISELDAEQKLSDNLDLETLISELTQINQRNTIVEEKLVAAIKLFIEQKLSNNKHFGDEENNKEIMDALKTLNISKTLFLKLLKDPNSVLVKHMQNVEHISSEEKPVDLKADELITRKPRNFFRRKSKSMESYPLMDCHQSPNKIVILKPGPAGQMSPQSEIASRRISLRSDNSHNMDNEKNTSQFSFTEIKRKLRHAMGKERNGKNESFGWSSPNRNHFYTERFTLSPSASFKKVEPVGKVKDSRFGGSDLYIEAKKHLSEMLKNGDDNAGSLTGISGQSGQLSKPLGRILSFPEYYGDDIFITAQMRLSPRGVTKNITSGVLQENNNNNYPSPRRQSLESQPCSNSEDRDFTLEIESLSEDGVVADVRSSSSIVAEIEEMTDSRPNEEGNSIINISLQSSSCLNDEDIQKRDTREMEDDRNASRSDLFEEEKPTCSPTMSPSHSPVSIKVKDSNSAIDKIERPSPVSVLEPLFTEDDISPPSTISQPVEKEIEPRHIHFEEQSSASINQAACTRISLEDEESAFEYVEAVLLGSGLNWDEFLSRWLSLHEVLDSSLFDEVELFSSRPRHDQKLLFDCANEALNELCESYFGCYTGIVISCVKPNIQTVPKAMDLINEIWKRVECRLFEQLQPRSLEQLINADLERSGKWMNLKSDIELIGSEMEENMLNEIVDDFLLSFVDSNDNNASDCEFEVVRDEVEAIGEMGS